METENNHQLNRISIFTVTLSVLPECVYIEVLIQLIDTLVYEWSNFRPKLASVHCCC